MVFVRLALSGASSGARSFQPASRLCPRRNSLHRGALKPSWREGYSELERRDVWLGCASSGISKTTTELRELNAQDYYSFLENEAGSDLVVVDFYTDWCGPCKLMYPELLLMKEEYRDQGVQIVKFNCNKENKAIGKALDIRVAPTFFLYKNGAKLASMTGAKVDQLRALIQGHMS